LLAGALTGAADLSWACWGQAVASAVEEHSKVSGAPDTLREHMSEHDATRPGRSGPSGELLLTVPILERIHPIEGWLTDAEADVLIAAAAHVCTMFPPNHAIVEVGSFQGRSTVALASVAALLSPSVRIHAIDPHEGEAGAADQRERYAPTLARLQHNLLRAGIAEQVVVRRARSYEVDWEGPISLLFVDGLHDYENCARDFHHFQPHLAAGGLAAFHDYGDWPGVTAVVGELLARPGFSPLARQGSMILLRWSGH
jgi:hypothetical protein